MTPEQQARERIDEQLEQCGWSVQNHGEMNLSAGLGVAVREFPLRTGFADYLLYADGKAIGVAEAKPEGHTLTGVEPQWQGLETFDGVFTLLVSTDNQVGALRDRLGIKPMLFYEQEGSTVLLGSEQICLTPIVSDVYATEMDPGGVKIWPV